jgi:hypothetical protein
MRATGMTLPFDDVSITLLREAMEAVARKDFLPHVVAGFLLGIIMATCY